MALLLTATLCTSAPGAQTPATAATLRNATALRDTFIGQVHAAGFTCTIAPPTIVVEDVPSFGQYDVTTNTLHTSEWTLLNPREKAFFVQLAGPGATEDSAHAVFEKAAHQWIFIHELGHWWQACRNPTASSGQPWQVESGANRISLAYWRQNDPSVPALMFSLFHAVLDHAPSPVPAGQSVDTYFNTNYQTLGPSPAYPWFQSKMAVMLEDEKPAPTFAAVLASTTK